MPRLARSARAEEDLIEIWLRVASDNPAAADKLLDAIDSACRRLAKNPRLGPARPDLAAGLRYFPVGRHLVLYREVPDGAEIVRVLHGARYLPDLLG
jgi:toxin ParE1/3/4